MPLDFEWYWRPKNFCSIMNKSLQIFDIKSAPVSIFCKAFLWDYNGLYKIKIYIQFVDSHFLVKETHLASIPVYNSHATSDTVDGIYAPTNDCLSEYRRDIPI